MQLQIQFGIVALLKVVSVWGMCGLRGVLNKNGGQSSWEKSRNDQADFKSRPVILAVGEVATWRAAGKALPMDSQIAYADFSSIDSDLLKTLVPDIVLSPLLSRSFDCMDLAQVLDQSGFRGRFRVFTTKLPSPSVIIGEVKAICPNLDFDFIFSGQDGQKHLI